MPHSIGSLAVERSNRIILEVHWKDTWRETKEGIPERARWHIIQLLWLAANTGMGQER